MHGVQSPQTIIVPSLGNYVNTCDNLMEIGDGQDGLKNENELLLAGQSFLVSR